MDILVFALLAYVGAGLFAALVVFGLAFHYGIHYRMIDYLRFALYWPFTVSLLTIYLIDRVKRSR